jgi:hypothetical protein
MPLTKGSGPEDPDPAIFVIDLPDVNKKLFFVKKCMLITYLLLEGTFKSFFRDKDKMSKRSHKIGGNQGFSNRSGSIL